MQAWIVDTNGRPDGIDTSSEWMLLTDERPDSRQGHLGGILGSNFSELESAQNLSGTSEIAFFMLVTLILS